MTAPPDWEPTIMDMWPTILVRRRLLDADAHNPSLVVLVEEMDRANRRITTQYQGVDLFGVDHAGVRWLRAAVNDLVRGYLYNAGITYPVTWTTQAWPNLNRFGDYHTPHNHGWSYLSGTYYVKMPADDSEPDGLRDAQPAAISFFDPRTGVNLWALAGETDAEPEYTLRPEPGTLLLWHASLQHLVHPNLARDARISISFNVVLEWANHYVEDATL